MPPGDTLGIPDPCHLMQLIIRNKNIYGLGVVFWTVCMLSWIMSFSHTNAYVTKLDLGIQPKITILAIYMAAILVMWPVSHKQTFIPPSPGYSLWNLTSIGPVFP